MTFSVLYTTISPYLDERTNRLFVAASAKVYGRGGKVALNKITGLCRDSINNGLEELDKGTVIPQVDFVKVAVGGRVPKRRIRDWSRLSSNWLMGRATVTRKTFYAGQRRA